MAYNRPVDLQVLNFAIMGVDTQTWRSRIGSYSAGYRLNHSSPPRGCVYFPRSFLLLSVLTLSVILTIGCVETNPGPKFQCLVCLSKPEFATIYEHIHHQKVHDVDKNFCFSCPACPLQFGTLNALDLHVHYCHREERNLPVTENPPQACNVTACGLLFPSTKLLCQHLKKDHLKIGQTVQCPFKALCKRDTEFSGTTFAVHLSQYHKGWNTVSSTSSTQSVINPTSNLINSEQSATDSCSNFINLEMDDGNVGMDVDYSDDGTQQDLDCHSEQVEPQDDKMNRWKEDFYRHLAMFYLRLEGLHLVPVSTINVIAKSLAQLTSTNMCLLREAIVHQFEGLGLSEDDVERRVNSILSEDVLFAAHHKDVAGPTLTTNALRKSYYESHFDFIVPKEINMSKDPHNPRCVYYCKIKKTLELFLAKPEIQQKVEESFSRESKIDTLEDYQDGSLHKKRKLNHPEKTIDLFIFMDEFAPTKDLSSVAHLHKILGVYYTIGNLPQHLRAKLDCKRLIMLIPDYASMFSDFKVGLFKVLVKELMKLQSKGVNFKGEQVKVRLRFLKGDNKGQHEVGGFIQSFSSEYFCRYCPMSKTEINAEPWKVGPLRTPQSYEEFSKLVPRDRATYKGVSRPEWLSPFNKLEDFHVCDPSLMPCIGHDLYLGVINYDLALILQHLVKKKNWFSYPQLNRLIKKFKFNGMDSGNRPAPVKFEKKKKTKETKSITLGGHAVQNWTLLRMLPFILDSDLIKDPNDPYWQLYLRLKQITERLSAPITSLFELGYLKAMIQDYMVDRQPLLGDGKPKHHFLAHFCDLMSMVGPIVHFSALGFEQFHQFFKNAAKSGKNFINLGFSLTKKYCLYLIYLGASSSFTSGIKIHDPGVTVAFQKNRMDEDLISLLLSKNISDSALIMDKIEVDGLQFIKGQWILLRNLSDSDIELGKVKFVILDGTSAWLIMEKHSASYLSDVGIYVISDKTEGIACVSYEELRYPLPQSVYQWGNYELCFSLKHSLSPYASE